MLRYKALIILALSLAGRVALAQELFVYSEPASNMPKKSLAIRMTNWLMQETAANRTNYHLTPELMWGVNKHLMLHAETFLSNKQGSFACEGWGTYAKYRFFSTDKVHRHFRMAAFGRFAVNTSNVLQEEIATNGLTSGYQLGLVGTQLLHKTALSVTAYYESLLEPSPMYASNNISYTLSAGHLILPKKYNNYKQTNLNIMAEVLGQVQPETGHQYIDVAPSLQLIFNSQARVDIGYRHELYSSMQRAARNGLLVRLEYLFYNAL